MSGPRFPAIHACGALLFLAAACAGGDGPAPAADVPTFEGGLNRSPQQSRRRLHMVSSTRGFVEDGR